MKNAISALLIFCMILSSSACSKATKTTDTSSETSPSEKTSVTEKETATETETEAATETETEPEPTTEITFPDPLPVNNEYFPDAHFLSYVHDNIDTDSDWFLSNEEREAVKVIEMNSDFELTSLVGIEHFPNLTELSFEGAYVTSLDASKNPALELIDCFCNQITELDASGCSNLKRIFGQTNPITKLNVTGCTSLESVDLGTADLDTLTGLSDCKNLKELWIGDVNIHDLDLSALPKLEILYCNVDDLSELDTSHNPLLKDLGVGGKTGKLDVSRNTELEYLAIAGWEDTSTDFPSPPDLSHNPKLSYIGISGTNLRSIDLSNNPALESVNIVMNPDLTELDLSANPKVNYLYCYGNALTSINISNNPDLEEIMCDNNCLSEIDISGNPKLRVLQCGKNKITSLDTSSCPHLSVLHCDSNELTSLDLSKNLELKELRVDHNNITELNVHGIKAFKYLKDEEPLLRDGGCRYIYEKDFDTCYTIECDPEMKLIF